MERFLALCLKNHISVDLEMIDTDTYDDSVVLQVKLMDMDTGDSHAISAHISREDIDFLPLAALESKLEDPFNRILKAMGFRGWVSV